MAKTKKEKQKPLKTVTIETAGELKEINLNAKSKLSRKERTGYFFVLPYVVAFLIFSVYPVLRTFWLSFLQYDSNAIRTNIEFVGLKQYQTVLTDQVFWEALRNTVKIWGVNIVLQLGLAFLLTIIFSDIKYKIRGIGVYRAIYYLPNIIAATSIAFLFSTLLDPYHGSFNQILSKIMGHPVTTQWLGDPKKAFIVVAIIQAWMWFGNSFIMLMAGVMGINSDYYEAAAIDGAGRWKMFTKITLPLLKPIMLYVGVTSLIGGLQMFDLPQIMFKESDPAFYSIRTVIMYLYRFGFNINAMNVGRAAATAYILFFIILVFSVLQFVLMRDKED
jgi:multiple sugar transport system permease protein